MKIFVGADHGGFEMKEMVKIQLEKNGHQVWDVGASEKIEGDDYVDYGAMLARELKKIEGSRGILFCRNGFGMMIVANRFAHVRCGLGFDLEAVRRGRRDDDINCLSVPADYLSGDEVVKIVEAFLEEKFSEEYKYKRRLEKLENVI